jgi:hypothetical protein
VPTLNQVKDLLDPKKLPFPPRPKVIDLKVDPYIDSLGDDALQIWVLLDEDTTEADRSVANLRAIRRAISDALLNADIDWFPYTRIATIADLQEAGIEL